MILLIVIINTTHFYGQQNSGKDSNLNDIKGYVLDSQTGEPLVYANVIIKNKTIGASTNIRGYFILLDVPAEDNTLIVSYIGAKPKRLQSIMLPGIKRIKDSIRTGKYFH